MSDETSRTVDLSVLQRRTLDVISTQRSADWWEAGAAVSALSVGLFSSLATLFFYRCAKRRTTQCIPWVLYPLVGTALGAAAMQGWSLQRARSLGQAEQWLAQDFERAKEADAIAEELFGQYGRSLPLILKFVQPGHFGQEEQELLEEAGRSAAAERKIKGEMERAVKGGAAALGTLTLFFTLAVVTRRARLTGVVGSIGLATTILCQTVAWASLAASAGRRQKRHGQTIALGLRAHQEDFESLRGQLEEVGEETTRLKVTLPLITYEELQGVISHCPHLESLTIKSLIFPQGDLPMLGTLQLKELRLKRLAHLPIDDLATLPRTLEQLELWSYEPTGECLSLHKHRKLRSVCFRACNDRAVKQLATLPSLTTLELKSLDHLEEPGKLYSLPGRIEKMVLPNLPENSLQVTDPLRGLRTLELEDPDGDSIEHLKALRRLSKVKLGNGSCLGADADFSWFYDCRMLDELKIVDLWQSGLDVSPFEEIFETAVFLIPERKKHLEKSELPQLFEEKRGRIITIKRLHPYN